MATGLIDDVPALEDATQKQLMRVMEDNATLRVVAEMAVPATVLELLYMFSTVSFHTPDGTVACYPIKCLPIAKKAPTAPGGLSAPKGAHYAHKSQINATHEPVNASIRLFKVPHHLR
jgi:hypothetical protein